MISKIDTNKSPITSRISKPQIGFAGITHLGINTAVATAAHGFSVVAFQSDTNLVTQLNKGELHVAEPGLLDLLNKHKKEISFSFDPESLAQCDIVYIAVDVPTDDEGVSDLSLIHNMIKKATSVMNPNALLIILCQVPPGFTRKVNWPLKQLYYQVETLVFGRAVETAMHPERFILGCENPGEKPNEVLVNYLRVFDCPILPMKYESAELAKISINIYLAGSVGTANTLAEICEQIGADWSEIEPALRLDKRIGQYSYLRPGLGIAGGNFERDLFTALQFANRYKTDGGMIASLINNSKHRKEWAWNTFKTLGLDKELTIMISLLGLTYKENTNSVKNSPALAFLSHLTNHKVIAFDPAAAKEATPSNVNRVESIIEAIKGADVLAIMTPWPEFREITPEIIAQNMNGSIVLDPYRMLEYDQVKALELDYFTLGKSNN